ncbi:MAG TPA: hypothetical protein VFJ30_06480 [Phycisphaerae bacterium]|nr:hypothetical protein [Phycisphaerae bacterium]
MSKSNFVAGIYNYCDRWCERCPYTGRCRVFHETERAEQRRRRKGQDTDSMEAAMAEVSWSFKKARRLLARSAKSQGLNLEELAADADQAEEAAEAEADQAADQHPISVYAEQYTDACAKLLEKLHDAFNDSADDARHRARFMDVAEEAEHLLEVREAVEVLGWDHMLITVKIMRAIRSQQDARREDPDLAEISLHDAAGSASVAHRCLRRSQDALLAVYKWDEQFRDDAIGLLAKAKKLQADLERHIPHCLTFPWPPPEAAEA